VLAGRQAREQCDGPMEKWVGAGEGREFCVVCGVKVVDVVREMCL